MKTRNSMLAAVILVLCLGIALFTFQFQKSDDKEEKKVLRIGVTLYRGDDSFINNLCRKMEEQVKAYEKDTEIRVVLDIVNAKGSQNTQNSQVDRFVSLGVDVICVNMVDRSAASYIINRAMEGDIPVVFFNREPVEEDMNRWEKLYYVGEDAKESAVLQGNILVDAYKQDPNALDLNGDGKVSYVLLEGETNHQDSLIRTEWSIQTLKDGGVPLEKITGGIGNWEKSQGSAWMEKWLEDYPNEIELVISNNDDMALGAADALERKKITDPIKIVGIDGTPQGIEGLESGKLYGTVQCDSDEYANVIFKIASAAGLGQDVQEEIQLKYGKYYNCSQKALVTNQR